MISTNPYLQFNGNTEEAMNFYKFVFGGEFIIFQRYKDILGGEKMLVSDQEKIMHISLAISKGITLMATDGLESMGRTAVFGNNFHIVINAESEAEVDRIFPILAEQGKIEMPLNKTFFGSYFGMCKDKFGVYWMINYSYPQIQ